MDRGRIAALTVFTGLPDEELDAVAAVASEQDFAAGQVLMAEREFGWSLFVVETGSADVSIKGSQVREIGPGDVVGGRCLEYRATQPREDARRSLRAGDARPRAPCARAPRRRA